MDSSQPAASPLDHIQSVICKTGNDPDRFAETLRREQIPHLSYSQVIAVEFCPHRYELQYLRRIEPSPAPDYFTKGKLLHQIIAATYRSLDSPVHQQPEETIALIQSHYTGESRAHLMNSVQLHLDNLWQGYAVVGVEVPFVFFVEESLPPVVGVIDLILRRNSCYIVIDHKTGRDFYPQDALQMAIYWEYIRRQYPQGRCEFYYETYRWVKDLNRIRKPAFQRTAVQLSSRAWEFSLGRLRDGYQKMAAIQKRGWSSRQGECFRCPYRRQC